MNWTVIGIAIPVVIWLLGLSFALGRLWEKVKTNCDDIQKSMAEIEKNRKENREDHRLIFNKLEDVLKMMRNGYGKGTGSGDN
jgi:hypothetical protein